MSTKQNRILKQIKNIIDTDSAECPDGFVSESEIKGDIAGWDKLRMATVDSMIKKGLVHAHIYYTAEQVTVSTDFGRSTKTISRIYRDVKLKLGSGESKVFDATNTERDLELLGYDRSGQYNFSIFKYTL
jgi:hypothetical protein